MMQIDLRPSRMGGGEFHKIDMTMHDTVEPTPLSPMHTYIIPSIFPISSSRLFFQCNGANKTASLIQALKDFSGRTIFGDDEWEALPDDRKKLLDSLCGNHTRNLPAEAFNRRFESYLKDKLGEDFDMARKASGFRARLEPSGSALLW